MCQPLSTMMTLLLQLVHCSQLISTLKIVQASLNFCYMVLEWFHSFFFGYTWLLWRLQSFLSSGRYSSNILTRGQFFTFGTYVKPNCKFTPLHFHNILKIHCCITKMPIARLCISRKKDHVRPYLFVFFNMLTTEQKKIVRKL